ncbi:MAG: Fpg/Nei family DNA glycosylase [Propionibacteriaceae bacterium]|nr:Fpg/Nei family DNA glycosylase [Propionibacteriaceae bacterium]
MPELPEVEALRRFLTGHAVGLVVERAEVISFAVLKTVGISPQDLAGRRVESVARRGKFLGVELGGAPGTVWLVMHLAKAGWLRWRDDMPPQLARPSRGPLAFRLVLTDGKGFDLTEAGTRQRLAVYLVHDLADVPGIVSLGPEPLDGTFTPSVLDDILDQAGGAQIKGVLRDQHNIAGIGNAYSDEILWSARLSPFAAAGRLSRDQRAELFEAIAVTLHTAINQAAGLGTGELKAEKKAGLQVHARAGQPCPRCGAMISEVSFADSSLQYCPTCQTGGRVLADRRLSRLLK